MWCNISWKLSVSYHSSQHNRDVNSDIFATFFFYLLKWDRNSPPTGKFWFIILPYWDLKTKKKPVPQTQCPPPCVPVVKVIGHSPICWQMLFNLVKMWNFAWTQNIGNCYRIKKVTFCDFLHQIILHFHIIAKPDPAASNSIYSLNWEALQGSSSDRPTLSAVLKVIL